MQSRKHRIFQGKRQNECLLPVDSDRQEVRHLEPKETMALNSSKEKRKRVKLFKANRVYQRPKSEPKDQGHTYTYNVEHIQVQGSLFTCKLFDCTKADDSEEEKRKAQGGKETPEGQNRVQTQGSYEDKTKEGIREGQHVKSTTEGTDTPGRQEPPVYHATFIPNTDPSPPRKTTIFIPRHYYSDTRYASASKFRKRRRTLSSSRKYVQKVEDLPQLTMITEESDPSKLNSSNNSSVNTSLMGNRSRVEAPSKR